MIFATTDSYLQYILFAVSKLHGQGGMQTHRKRLENMNTPTVFRFQFNVVQRVESHENQ
jgi:hypothetical protein